MQSNFARQIKFYPVEKNFKFPTTLPRAFEECMLRFEPDSKKGKKMNWREMSKEARDEIFCCCFHK